MSMSEDSAGDLRRFRMDLSYDGSPFYGWSRQPGLPTVEGALREAFEQVLGYAPQLRVGGRTDAGVHARRQTVSADLPADVEPERLSFALNSLTPAEIVVTSLAPSRTDFDARADARSRAYRYYLWLERPESPFCYRWAWRRGPDLDVDQMAAAAREFEGRHDFTAFTPAKTAHVHFTREVMRCRLCRRGSLAWLSVEADAFLRHMVRAMIGTLVEIGDGTRDSGSLRRLLEGAERAEAGPTAPAHGLFLWMVRYQAPTGGKSGASAP